MWVIGGIGGVIDGIWLDKAVPPQQNLESFTLLTSAGTYATNAVEGNVVAQTAATIQFHLHQIFAEIIATQKQKQNPIY